MAVGKSIARAIWNNQGLFIKDVNEPWCIPLGRRIAAPIGIGGRQNQERAFGDEVHGKVIEAVNVLILQTGGCFTDNSSKRLFCADDGHDCLL